MWLKRRNQHTSRHTLSISSPNILQLKPCSALADSNSVRVKWEHGKEVGGCQLIVPTPDFATWGTSGIKVRCGGNPPHAGHLHTPSSSSRQISPTTLQGGVGVRIPQR